MTDWDKELAKIDRQLASISDEELMRSTTPVAPASAGATGRPKALPASRSASALSTASSPVTRTDKPWEAWAKVLVAVAAAAGLMYWPWPGRCGAPLMGFTAATGSVALLGIWSAVGTWRHRLGWAHVASLLVTVWGGALGAREVLPRVGYAIPTIERPAQWSCDGLPTAAPAMPPAPTDASGGAVPGPVGGTTL
jgi:hypothetical protein